MKQQRPKRRSSKRNNRSARKSSSCCDRSSPLRQIRVAKRKGEAIRNGSSTGSRNSRAGAQFGSAGRVLGSVVVVVGAVRSGITSPERSRRGSAELLRQ